MSLAALLLKNSDAWDSLEVTGHADKRGKETVNLILSEARAKSVADFLESQKIGKQRISYSGKGEREPLDPGNSAEARRSQVRLQPISLCAQDMRTTLRPGAIPAFFIFRLFRLERVPAALPERGSQRALLRAHS